MVDFILFKRFCPVFKKTFSRFRKSLTVNEINLLTKTAKL